MNSRRVAETSTRSVRGFRVPKPINAHWGFKVIEMGIVEPPYLLDFGTSSTDLKPDFEQEVWQTWWETVAENFGERFPDAESVYCHLRDQLRIWHLDLRPSNLCFLGGRE